MAEQYLTTTDNPYHPVDQFQEWYQFDISHGYHTLDLLGRVMVTAPTLSPADVEDAQNRAIAEIVSENISGVHRVVGPDGTPITE